MVSQEKPLHKPLFRERFSLIRFLLGQPLATNELEHQTVGRPVGLAVFA